MKYLMAGKARCRHLVVGITNPDPTLTAEEAADPTRSSVAANPLTYFERYVMVRAALLEAGVDYRDLSVVPFPVSHPALYHYYVPTDAVFFLTIYDQWGRRKLEMFQSRGLRTEVMWEKPISEKGLTGAEVRRRMVDGEAWEHLVPPSVAELLIRWRVSERLRPV